jgi:hypothetical protein
MGSLRETSTGRIVLLEPEHQIGRAPSCALRLEKRYVSALHAALRWSGSRWELRDHGSRNGTFLHGTRLQPGEQHTVRVGATVSFGKPDEELWELTDESGPTVMAVPVGGGAPVLIDGELLALPSNDDPRATIYRTTEGTWVLEQPDDSTTTITNLQTFEIAGRIWRFCCSESIRTTSIAVGSSDIEVKHLQLAFAVSRDEEHVELQAMSLGKTFALGARTHNYLLLTLARRRLSDAAEGLPETSCGWVYMEDLAHDPSMAAPQLNIDVFRIRKQFASLGVVDAANIVERRPRTRQLRIGTGLISVSQL